MRRIQCVLPDVSIDPLVGCMRSLHSPTARPRSQNSLVCRMKMHLQVHDVVNELRKREGHVRDMRPWSMAVQHTHCIAYTSIHVQR
jgi:hypothetical protein